MNMKKKRVSKHEFEKTMQNDAYCNLTQTEKDVLTDYFINHLSIQKLCIKYGLKIFRVRRLLHNVYGSLKQQEEKDLKKKIFNSVSYESYVGNITPEFILERAFLYGFSQRETLFFIDFFVEGETAFNIAKKSLTESKGTLPTAKPTNQRELKALFKLFVQKINEDQINPHPFSLFSGFQCPVPITPEYAAWDCQVFQFHERDYLAICEWLPFQNLNTIPSHLKERCFLSFYRAFFIEKNQNALTISETEIAAERQQRKRIFETIEEQMLVNDYQKSLMWLIDFAHAPIKKVALLNNVSNAHVYATHSKNHDLIFCDNDEN